MNENIERVLAMLDGFRTNDEITYSAYSTLHDEISLLDDFLKEQKPLVRCKDCKHYAVEDHYGNFHGYKILAASDVPVCHRWGNDACMVKPDGYCFLAEGRRNK